jgi:HSP20 family protein
MNIATQENRTPALKPAEQTGYITPYVDIETTESGYVLHAEMPGVTREGIEVTVEDSELVLTGHRRDLAVTGELIHRETRPLSFRRIYELDSSIDTGKITARIDQGILTVTLPKAESVKPRRIELQ